ncbi:DUF1294 domain-containing protein [Devosia sp.]|uniref:DUF1294 domain-containing protein n=1 Tax=Devosia sp. TaxID=1871048 RepID=UPI002AFFEE89|nr:DUF1294 domain-containing protein [Devosia sp.]
MRRSGELIQWNNKSGYGFVRDQSGRDYYVHISAVSGDARPRLGDQLSFETRMGRKGRPSASDVTVIASSPVPAPSLRQAIQSPSGISRYHLGLRTAVATLLTLLILFIIAADRSLLWLGLVYVGMGVGSALLYRFDKLYALAGQYRVSESNLHLVDLCGGIIGGLAAQEVYRHKTVKPAFVATTWAIALAHLLCLTLLAFAGRFL